MKRKYFIKAILLVVIMLMIINVNITFDFSGGEMFIGFGARTYAAVGNTTVNFPESTSSSSRSQTITIPELHSVSGVTVNPGNANVAYSVSGNNVTITVSGGSPMNSYTSTSTGSGSITRNDTNFPDSYYYSSGGYSGYIGKSGGYSSTVTGGSPADSKTVTDTYTRVCTLTENDNGYYHDDHGNVDPAPNSKPYNDGTYSGTMGRTTTSVSKSVSNYTTIEKGKTINWTITVNTYTAHYAGIATKPDTRTYSYTQGYYGTVYGSTTYYYSYIVTVNYRTNNSPVLSVTSPVLNGAYGGSLVPAISVSDPDGDVLTCKYYLDSNLKETRTISNTATAQLISFNTLDTSMLSEGSHSFKFEVNDGIAPAVSQTVTATVDREPPIIGEITCVADDTSITISGKATDNISDIGSLQYRYTAGGIITDWTKDTTGKITSLSPDTLYTVKFEAKDRAGHISQREQQVRTKIQIPQVGVSSSKETAINIFINDSNPATTQYQIMLGSCYIAADGTQTSVPQWLNLTDKRITITGLSPNTPYTLKAKARNNEGIETSYSLEKAATTLALPPKDISAIPGKTSMKISWNAVSGATGYDIEADGKIIDNGSSTTYVHSGLLQETYHTYRVRVKNAGGTGEWSEIKNAATLPYPPEAPSIANIEEFRTKLIITWDAVAAATGYDIEADGKIIDTGTSTSYEHAGLAPDTLHKYRVRAKNAGGESDWSKVLSRNTLPDPPVVPENIKAGATKTTVTVTWNAAERAEGYEIEADDCVINAGAGTSYTHNGLIASSTHKYRLRAWNRGGKSEWSIPVEITTLPEKPVTPSNIMAVSEKDAITLSWYNVPYAESYDIQIDGKDIVNVITNEYAHKGLKPDVKRTYRVRAKNISGESEWSRPMAISTLPEESLTGGQASALTNIVAVVTNKAVTISWDAVLKNAAYEVEVDGLVSDNGRNTVYNHTGLEPNSFHTYKVRVKDSTGNGEWCAALALSTLPNPPDAPANIVATAANTQIELRWDKINGASYDIEVDGKVVDNGEASTYIQNGLSPGSSHTYRVRAKNITGVTAWSTAITKSTISPTYEVECIKNWEFDFSLLAQNVKDFGGLKFVVTYNPDEIEAVDLCDFTAAKDITSSGRIPGTNINAVYSPGRIEFTVNESIVPGTAWSGEITAIVFRAKIDGKSNINFNVE